jgi:hypothetical protein
MAQQQKNRPGKYYADLALCWCVAMAHNGFGILRFKNLYATGAEKRKPHKCAFPA